ncbi:Uncharacterized protein conserved in bacteria [Leminorella richardii]|uniref:Uncharacterized protein conserved in bacteria n=1 Tax=Leminorella richardii TaxID=158841 RepID=A0A2X4Y6M6_9GAMM|nr:Uncharacterized protein conserved in bacteria [Leminorella richardii]
MINISTLRNPLSSAIEELLGLIKRICAAQNISFFIAGATAREILLHHVHARSAGVVLAMLISPLLSMAGNGSMS